jgi:hypothetical protein
MRGLGPKACSDFLQMRARTNQVASDFFPVPARTNQMASDFFPVPARTNQVAWPQGLFGVFPRACPDQSGGVALFCVFLPRPRPVLGT